MASADEGQQEPADGGQQEPVNKRARGGGQEIPQEASDFFPDDGDQQQRGGSIVAVPDCPQVLGGGQQMLARFTIGTKTIYVCTKGSGRARTNEVLVLRCMTGTWTAFDSTVSVDGLTLPCRQPVFRCPETDITQPGWHTWQTNYAASRNDAGHDAMTRVP